MFNRTHTPLNNADHGESFFYPKDGTLWEFQLPQKYLKLIQSN